MTTEKLIEELWIYAPSELAAEVQKRLLPRGSAAAACPGAGSEADGGGQGDVEERPEPVEPRASRTEAGVDWQPASSPPDADLDVLVATNQYEVGEGSWDGSDWFWTGGAMIGDTVEYWTGHPLHPNESERSERVRDAESIRPDK